MKITVAKHAGFCFGVRRATDTLEQAILRGASRIVTLGRLIHNDGYCQSLKERGVEQISVDDIPALCAAAEAGEAVTVVIRAHGEIDSVIRTLEECAARCPSLTVLNCTCPYVEKVRRIAREHSGEGKRFFLLGTADHPEVRGILSCAQDGIVFGSAAELQQLLWQNGIGHNDGFEVAIASQTTQNLSEWEKCLEILKKVYTNAQIFDTICSVTEERQTEAAALARECDAMLVIGSAASSNTAKLRDVCSAFCPRTYPIESAEDISALDLSDCQTVSITAGASTPFSVIQEVKQTMAEQMMENFEELLEQSLKTLNTGDVVTGVITSISQNEIHLDLGSKATGVITHDKLTDDPSAKLSELFKVGDVVKAKVIKVSDIDGIATLDKTRVDTDANWDLIVAAAENNETLEGRVSEAVKGGVVMSVKSVRIFIPASQTGVPKDGDLSTLVGTTQKIKLIEIKQERKKAYGSIRAVLREERKAQEEAFWNELEIGKEFDGEVKSLTSYGAFVDLGGVDGMVHTTELSWRRIRQPSDVVSVGDKLHVFVKSFDREKGRISLGYKTEEMNPWFIFTNKYQIGDTASVKIVSLMPFGAFAELVPGVDGLIHISQIADHKIAKPDDVLAVGQVVDAKITDIDNENHKVSLSMRALLEQPAVEEEVVEEAAEDNGPVIYSTDNPDSYKSFAGDEE